MESKSPPDWKSKLLDGKSLWLLPEPKCVILRCPLGSVGNIEANVPSAKRYAPLICLSSAAWQVVVWARAGEVTTKTESRTAPRFKKWCAENIDPPIKAICIHPSLWCADFVQSHELIESVLRRKSIYRKTRPPCDEISPGATERSQNIEIAGFCPMFACVVR